METGKIFNRKKELIERDPLYSELFETFRKIKDTKRNNDSLDMSSYQIGEYSDNILHDIKHHYASPYCTDKDRDKHEKQYPDHWNFFKLSGTIGLKWSIHIRFSAAGEISITSFLNDEAIWVGRQPFNEYTTHNASIHYPELKWLPYPNPYNKKPMLADINTFVTQGYNKTGATWVPIVINVSQLNMSDARNVKKHIWELLKSRLQKGTDKRPCYEYPELAFLYSIRREDTFKKYLDWYDLHTKEKLGYRVLALYERQKDKAKFLEKARCKKIKWGNPVKGEDKIEKAVKLIYKAIHRDDYSRKKIEPLIEEYNCHTHKNDCPLSCKNFKEWQGRFNRLNPV